MSNNNVYNLTLNLILPYNFTLANFEFSHFVCTPIVIGTFNSTITKFLNTTELIIMQSNTTGEIYVWNRVNQSLGTTLNIPTDEMFNFFNISTAFYLLQSRGLSLLSYNRATNELKFEYKIN